MKVEPNGVSVEVMAEEFYDACAWLRDLQTGDWPARVSGLSVTVDYPVVAIDDNEEFEAIIRGELTRLRDGRIHCHMDGVCANIDMALLEQKRPS